MKPIVDNYKLRQKKLMEDIHEEVFLKKYKLKYFQTTYKLNF